MGHSTLLLRILTIFDTEIINVLSSILFLINFYANILFYVFDIYTRCKGMLNESSLRQPSFDVLASRCKAVMDFPFVTKGRFLYAILLQLNFPEILFKYYSGGRSNLSKLTNFP